MLDFVKEWLVVILMAMSFCMGYVFHWLAHREDIQYYKEEIDLLESKLEGD